MTKYTVYDNILYRQCLKIYWREMWRLVYDTYPLHNSNNGWYAICRIMSMPYGGRKLDTLRKKSNLIARRYERMHSNNVL